MIGGTVEGVADESGAAVMGVEGESIDVSIGGCE